MFDESADDRDVTGEGGVHDRRLVGPAEVFDFGAGAEKNRDDPVMSLFSGKV